MLRRLVLMVATIVSYVSIAVTPVFSEDKDKEDIEPFSVGVFLGPSIPSGAIDQVYNQFNKDGVSYAYSSAASLGYHFGAKLRFGLVDMLSFSGGLQFTQFPGQSQTFTGSNGNTIELQTVTTYVPIYAGITFIPIKTLVSPYFSAEAMYSYRSVTISNGNSAFEALIVGNGQEIEPTTSRIGAALAAGIEFNLGGLKPFIELKYNMTNLVGKADGEETMGFLNVSLGLVF